MTMQYALTIIKCILGTIECRPKFVHKGLIDLALYNMFFFNFFKIWFDFDISI